MQLLAITAEEVVTAAAKVAGTAALAGLLAGAVALLYRWYVRERVPRALALLVGLAGVAVVVNTTPLLAEEIADNGSEVEVLTALSNITLFVVGGLGAAGGARLGDAVATDLFAATGRDVDADVSEIVQSVGRVTTVELPEDVDDVVGYDPVPEATKETLAGRKFLFPRRLTRAELRERLVSRLKADYGVGHVDVEIAEDGTVEYLAVGSRAAGIGPTLPPATNAVAIRADPAHAASAGDLVQVWETDPARRVLTAELRGVAGDVVTVAIDAADTSKLDPTERYRLVTLPVQDRPDREFASLLRAADETMATVTVEAGSRLDGARVGDVEVTVAAITREDARPEPLPTADRTLEPGDVLYAIATPDLLRRLTEAADALGDAGAGASSSVSGARVGDDGPDAERTPADDGQASSDGDGRTQAAAQSAGESDEEAGSDDEPTDATAATADREAASEPVEGSNDEAAAGDGAATDSETATDDGTSDDGATGGDTPPAEPEVDEDATAATGDGPADLSGDAFPDAEDLPGSDLEAPTLPGDGDGTSENGDGAAASGEDGDVTPDSGDDPSLSADADDEDLVDIDEAEPADDGESANGDDAAAGEGDGRDETSVIDEAWDDLEPLVGEGDEASEDLNDLEDLLGEDGDDAPDDGTDPEVADGDESDRDGDERRE